MVRTPPSPPPTVRLSRAPPRSRRAAAGSAGKYLPRPLLVVLLGATRCSSAALVARGGLVPDFQPNRARPHFQPHPLRTRIPKIPTDTTLPLPQPRDARRPASFPPCTRLRKRGTCSSLSNGAEAERERDAEPSGKREPSSNKTGPMEATGEPSAERLESWLSPESAWCSAPCAFRPCGTSNKSQNRAKPTHARPYATQNCANLRQSTAETRYNLPPPSPSAHKGRSTATARPFHPPDHHLGTNTAPKPRMENRDGVNRGTTSTPTMSNMLEEILQCAYV